MYRHDQRTVMTLDAGGTNFVFSAIRGNQDIVETNLFASGFGQFEWMSDCFEKRLFCSEKTIGK